MVLGELHGRNLASALVRSRVHNRTRDRGGKPIWAKSRTCLCGRAATQAMLQAATRTFARLLHFQTACREEPLVQQTARQIGPYPEESDGGQALFNARCTVRNIIGIMAVALVGCSTVSAAQQAAPVPQEQSAPDDNGQNQNSNQYSHYLQPPTFQRTLSTR
jgi:hypothetical protein